MFAQKNVEFDPYTADIEENIKYPPVPQKNVKGVVAAMENLYNTLKNAGYTTSKVRSGEVVMVTIPASDLFAPNETILKDNASKKLKNLSAYVARKDHYKVIIAVHSDNTGDSQYTDNITAERATAVDDFFYHDNGSVDTGIIPYGLGDDEPVAPNSGVKNRAANRRVEIYFVPTKSFIDKSK